MSRITRIREVDNEIAALDTFGDLVARVFGIKAGISRVKKRLLVLLPSRETTKLRKRVAGVHAKARICALFGLKKCVHIGMR